MVNRKKKIIKLEKDKLLQKTASFYSEDGKTFPFLKLCSISKTILYLFY